MKKLTSPRARTFIALPAIAIIAVIAFAKDAYSIIITDGGIDYEIQTVFGSFDDHKDRIMASAWWGHSDLATSLSKLHAAEIPGENTPYYALSVLYGHVLGTEIQIRQGRENNGSLDSHSFPTYDGVLPPDGWAVEATDTGTTALLLGAGLLGLAAIRRRMGAARLANISNHFLESCPMA